MRVDVAGEIRDAWKVEGVIPALLAFKKVPRQQRRIRQQEHLMSSGQRQPRPIHRQPQRFFEAAQQQGHLLPIPPDHRDFPRLVGGNGDRAGGGLQPLGKAIVHPAVNRVLTLRQGLGIHEKCP